MGPFCQPYTMWGHLFLLLRDIAVNESDHERVSDSGAIRSGLVPQLRHSAIHKRSLARRTLSEGVSRLWPRHCNRRSRVKRRRPGARSEDATASTQDQWFLGAGRCTQENVTPLPALEPNAISPRSAQRLVIGHAPSVAMRLLAPIASARTAIICAPAIYCLELQPRCCATGSRLVASERTAIAGRYSNCGFEMGVCRTWWKRVS